MNKIINTMKPHFKNYITKQPDGTQKPGTFEGFLELPKIRDCVGNRIYEGSIVQDKKNRIGIIDYDPEKACFLIKFKNKIRNIAYPPHVENFYPGYTDDIRVIGHISNGLNSIKYNDKQEN